MIYLITTTTLDFRRAKKSVRVTYTFTRKTFSQTSMRAVKPRREVAEACGILEELP
jgi:hypothetical protein